MDPEEKAAIMSRLNVLQSEKAGLGNLHAVSVLLGQRRMMEQEYGNLYQRLVRAGEAPQLRKKYRLG